MITLPLYTSLVTCGSVVLSIGFLFFVGIVRQKYHVESPAMAGDPMVERALRIQYNTVEQIVLFLPMLWIFGASGHDMAAGILGAVWILGRLIYAVTYFKNPKSRELGFALTLFPTMIMLVWILIDLFK